MKNDFCAAPLFSDDMVLQRGKPALVWGSGGADGAEVRVSFAGVCGSSAVAGGAWSVLLPPLEAGLRGVLAISCGGEELRFSNVVTGDVWLAGGQSNMELELQNCKNGAAALAACANPDIRFYQPLKRGFVDEAFLRDEKNCRWQAVSPESAAHLSAVAYFFAHEVNAAASVPVGIINCNWGGTSIACWMSRRTLEKSAAGKKCIADYDAKIGEKTEAEYEAELAEYEVKSPQWEAAAERMKKANPDVTWEELIRDWGGWLPWPPPAGKRSPYRPGNLYEAMLKRTSPFSLRGFIYYQGEEDAEVYAENYAELMYYLVGQWRRDFSPPGFTDDSLPFLFAQLPMYTARTGGEAERLSAGWSLLREAQQEAARAIDSAYMAVIIDAGEYDNIHPLDKETVGHRLALLALRNVYGKDIAAEAPEAAYALPQGDTLRIAFRHAEGGLESRGPLAGFEAAGADGAYHEARASIDGETVILSSQAVPRPLRARYAWVKWGPTPLYGRKSGLPASPFRLE